MYLLVTLAHSYSFGQTDSWSKVKQDKKGTITALWYDIDPFIFHAQNGRLMGVEYELMESFARYVSLQYGYRLEVDWKNAGSFGNIYNTIRKTDSGGQFGWSFYSITPDRQKEVNFTPAYMPDLNVLVTSNDLPLFSTDSVFRRSMHSLDAYTMVNTTMEEDLKKLQELGKFDIHNEYDDYEVLRKVARGKNCFAYVPLTIYVVALQKGIKVKRQYIMATERPGFAGILPKNSDWQPIVNEYFQSFECKRTVTHLLGQYLGKEIGQIMMDGPGATASTQNKADIELLTKEREIVSQRLIETALQVEKEKILRYILIGSFVLFVIISLLFYNRYRTTKRLSEQLKQRNNIITRQNKEIELINRKLHMKVLQSQMNPHFIFNSLNDVQYFVNQGDKKVALSYISKFSKFMRSLLRHANEVQNTVAEEAKLLEQYLELEQTRFSNKFSYSVSFEPSISSAVIPALIVHPLVEDALYHGVLNSASDANISIRFSYEAPYLVCVIKDNGIGRKAAAEIARQKGNTDVTPHQHLLRERIAILNDEQPGKIVLNIEDKTSTSGEAKGTEVTLKILLEDVPETQIVSLTSNLSTL